MGNADSHIRAKSVSLTQSHSGPTVNIEPTRRLRPDRLLSRFTNSNRRIEYVSTYEQPPIAFAPILSIVLEFANIRPAAAHQRETCRAREPQTTTRTQCWSCWPDGAARGKVIHSCRWHPRSVVLSLSPTPIPKLTLSAIATVLSNWHTVLRAIHMASGMPQTPVLLSLCF